MPHIQPLDTKVAELIAAGEVVERPASVVKELVENAMDAGASAIAVEIRRGGMGMIRVSDDGCGIAPEELPTAFLRHATSKLRTASDLTGIGTLGFRGEALAAISAVSRTEITTRQHGAVSGAVLRLEGGVPGEVQEAGAPEGTTITVKDLFFNTPARLKFMRKDSAEAAAVHGLMQHLALSRPDISFRFRKDGQDALHTPGDGKLLSAIYAALGREFAVTLLPVEGRGGDIGVEGYVTAPVHGRGSRSMQVYFVNGRFIKSQLLTAAVEEAYHNQLLKGKYPGCVLSVTMPVELVDVNVHPAKTQIKFAREREVFDAVYHTVLDALTARGGPVPRQEAASLTAPSRQDFFQSMDAKTWREQGAASSGGKKPVWDTEMKHTVRLWDSAPRSAGETIPNGTPAETPVETPMDRPVPRGPEALFPDAPPERPEPSAPVSPPQREPVPAEQPPMEQQSMDQQSMEGVAPEEPPWRIAGELLRTYIVCESGNGDIYLIDKHAAHERVNFDRLRSQEGPPMRQTLLRPLVWEPGKEDAALLLENLSLLESLGFACEEFGDGSLVLRELPADLDPEDAPAVLEELASDLREGRSVEERRDRVLRTMACKAAIKGGWESDARELRVLADRVQSGEIRYCPHGRPVAVKLTGREIEKMFKRIV